MFVTGLHFSTPGSPARVSVPRLVIQRLVQRSEYLQNDPGRVLVWFLVLFPAQGCSPLYLLSPGRAGGGAHLMGKPGQT